MTTIRSARIAATLKELDDAASEYTDAKSSYDVALIKYEMAREKFAKIKELAIAMLGASDWLSWVFTHEEFKYVGIQLGDAINAALRVHAHFEASTFEPKGKSEFRPVLNLDAITRKLENGGYEFRSSAPQREVNAALINLGGVLKGKYGGYQTTDADEILGYYQKVAPEVPAQ